MILSCMLVSVINLTNFPWNDHDEKMLRAATRGCQTKHAPKVCPKKFIKTGERSYKVVCALPQED